MRLFELQPNINAPPCTYMEHEPNANPLIMDDVKEESEEQGDTDSAIDAAKCIEIEYVMQAAFWGRGSSN